MYDSQYFYDSKGGQTWQITDEHLLKIKNLKSYICDESDYYDQMLQWRLSDNSGITNIMFSSLFVSMQFITMSAKLKDDFIKNNSVENYHISLLRKLYLDYDTESNAITMGFKRPFGNSNVLDDVRKEMVRSCDGNAMIRDIESSSDYSEENKVLSEFVLILDKLFKDDGFELISNSFIMNKKDGLWPSYNSQSDETILLWKKYNKSIEHSHMRRWRFDISKLRDEKIKILIQK